jgi:predicted acyl esterase
MRSRRENLSFLTRLLGLLLFALSGRARAASSEYEKTEVMVSMRDGVHLHTLVYEPAKQNGSSPLVSRIDGSAGHLLRCDPRGRPKKIKQGIAGN